MGNTNFKHAEKKSPRKSIGIRSDSKNAKKQSGEQLIEYSKSQAMGSQKNRRELILPVDVSFGLKSLINGRNGMFFNPNGIEPLEIETWENKFFCVGVEKHLEQLKMTEEIFQNLKSMSKAVGCGEIPGITFRFKLDPNYSMALKSIFLLNGMDWWHIFWKGWGDIYFNPKDYDENYRIANKIHFMTKIKGSKYDINTITMEDINNYTLPI